MRIPVWPWLLIGAVLLFLIARTPFGDLPPIYAPPEDYTPEEGVTFGTAFSLGEGVWITAAHVIDHCQTIFLIDNEKQGWAAEDAFHHEDADAGVIVANFIRPALPLMPASETVAKDDYGLHIGFPDRRAEAFETQLLHDTFMRASDSNSTLVPIQVWNDQISPRDQSYPGLSGGPVLSGDGRVVGIAAAVAQDGESNNIFAIDKSIIEEMVKNRFEAVLNRAYASKRVEISNTTRFTKTVFEKDQVVRVLCIVG